MKFKPSNVKLNKSRTIWDFLSSALPYWQPWFSCKKLQILPDQKMLVRGHPLRWGHFTPFPFYDSRSILPFWWAFFMAVISCWSKPFPSNSQETLLYINKSNPTQPKALVLFLACCRVSCKIFLFWAAEEHQNSLCQKLMGLVFVNLIEKIHTTIWALFA